MRRIAAALVVAVVFAACTSSSPPTPPEPTAMPTGIGSAAAAMAKLCRRPPLTLPKTDPAAHVPDVIVETEHQVEAVRGLQYDHPVAVEAVTHSQLVDGLVQEFQHSYPGGQSSRRSLAWQTIGVLPARTPLGPAVQRYLSTQVVGFYDPATKDLFYIGTDNPTPPQHFILAHELTHAIDDQHFDLTRLNDIENTCDDERLEAAVGLVEGSAVYFSSQVMNRFFTPRQQNEVQTQGFTPPKGIPRFIVNQMQWPYIDGTTFVNDLVRRGGIGAVNDAMRRFPVSTEQIMHPEKYPSDEPTGLDIPDLGPKLGAGWRDLDVETIGEEWLQSMLRMRLDPVEADPAAAGWDGGLYRAWTDGKHVAVVLETAWDSPKDEGEFGHAVQSWVRAGQFMSLVLGPSKVTVLFASDQATLRRLSSAM